MTVAPWTFLGDTPLVKNRWIDLRAERCRTPSGAELDDFHVLHYPDWVAACALTADGRLVMTRQWRQGAKAVSLEFAGGAVEAGEPIEAAAARELVEETGYAGAPAERLATVCANPVSQTNRFHVLLIRDARRVQPPKADPFEQLEVEEMAPAALVEAAAGGGMVHPLHLTAVLMLRLHRPKLLGAG